MQGFFAHVTVVIAGIALAGCSAKPEAEMVDSSAPAMAPAPAMDSSMTMPSVGGAPGVERRGPPPGTRMENSGHVRIIGGQPTPVLVDGIEMRIPEDGIITLTNGTHRIQCSSHDIVITVDYQPRPAPVTADCRAP